MRENGCAHIRLDVNARQVPQIGDDPLCRRADEERGEHRAHHNQEGAHRLIGNVVVEHLARDHREQNIHQCDHQRAEHIQQEHAQMRLVERGKLAERAALGRGLFFKGGRRLIGACVVHHVILKTTKLCKETGSPTARQSDGRRALYHGANPFIGAEMQEIRAALDDILREIHDQIGHRHTPVQI